MSAGSVNIVRSAIVVGLEGWNGEVGDLNDSIVSPRDLGDEEMSGWWESEAVEAYTQDLGRERLKHRRLGLDGELLLLGL